MIVLWLHGLLHILTESHPNCIHMHSGWRRVKGLWFGGGEEKSWGGRREGGGKIVLRAGKMRQGSCEGVAERKKTGKKTRKKN